MAAGRRLGIATALLAVATLVAGVLVSREDLLEPPPTLDMDRLATDSRLPRMDFRGDPAVRADNLAELGLSGELQRRALARLRALDGEYEDAFRDALTADVRRALGGSFCRGDLPQVYRAAALVVPARGDVRLVRPGDDAFGDTWDDVTGLQELFEAWETRPGRVPEDSALAMSALLLRRQDVASLIRRPEPPLASTADGGDLDRLLRAQPTLDALLPRYVALAHWLAERVQASPERYGCVEDRASPEAP